MRKPDFTIHEGGKIYLRRWHLIPRNDWLNVYLHNMLGDDPSDLHDHPYWNVSIILRGGYWEHMPLYMPLYPEMQPQIFHDHLRVKFRRPGSIIFRKATDAHRLTLGRLPSWSLFITGRRKRIWGFWRSHGWAPYTEATRNTADGSEPA